MVRHGLVGRFRERNATEGANLLIIQFMREMVRRRKLAKCHFNSPNVRPTAVAANRLPVKLTKPDFSNSKAIIRNERLPPFGDFRRSFLASANICPLCSLASISA